MKRLSKIIVVLAATLLSALTFTACAHKEQTAEIDLSTESVSLALYDLTDSDKTEATVNVTVIYDGAEQENAAVSARSSDPSVCTVEGSTVKAVGEGEAEVTFSHTTASGKTAEKTLNVRVYMPIDETSVQSDVIIDLSKASGGYITVDKFADVDGETVIVDGDIEMKVRADGNGIMFAVGELVTGERKLLIKNDRYGVRFNAIVATKTLSSATELLSLRGVTDGYYVLTADIDANNNAAPMYFSEKGNIFETNVVKSTGGCFTGSFDGRGHTIKNLGVGENGLFGSLGGVSVVKNLALVDLSVPNEGAACALAYANAARIENVFVSGNAKKLISYSIGPNNSFTNIVANLTGENAVIAQNVASVDTQEIVGYGNPNVSFMKNITLITPAAKPRVTGYSRTAAFNGVSHDGARGLHAYSSVQKLKEAALDFSYLNEYWDISGDLPVFKSRTNNRNQNRGIL